MELSITVEITVMKTSLSAKTVLDVSIICVNEAHNVKDH